MDGHMAFVSSRFVNRPTPEADQVKDALRGNMMEA